MITDGYKIVLEQFRSADDLRPAKLLSSVSKQLRAQLRKWNSPYRYAVRLEIVEGGAKPAADLDNYAKPIIDAITQSRLLWNDDDQIDELVILRRRDGRCPESHATLSARRITGQHSGAPSHFRARCAEASRATITYADLGYYLAGVLQGEAPYDFEEDDWLNEISRLTEFLAAGQDEDAWIWFHEHLPKFMELVPNRRKEGFLSGVMKAHEDGKFDE